MAAGDVGHHVGARHAAPAKPVVDPRGIKIVGAEEDSFTAVAAEFIECVGAEPCRDTGPALLRISGNFAQGCQPGKPLRSADHTSAGDLTVHPFQEEHVLAVLQLRAQEEIARDVGNGAEDRLPEAEELLGQFFG